MLIPCTYIRYVNPTNGYQRTWPTDSCGMTIAGSSTAASAPTLQLARIEQRTTVARSPDDLGHSARKIRDKTSFPRLLVVANNRIVPVAKLVIGVRPPALGLVAILSGSTHVIGL